MVHERLPGGPAMAVAAERGVAATTQTCTKAACITTGFGAGCSSLMDSKAAIKAAVASVNSTWMHVRASFTTIDDGVRWATC